jgi:hypothetical protein
MTPAEAHCPNTMKVTRRCVNTSAAGSLVDEISQVFRNQGERSRSRLSIHSWDRPKEGRPLALRLDLQRHSPTGPNGVMAAVAQRSSVCRSWLTILRITKKLSSHTRPLSLQSLAGFHRNKSRFSLGRHREDPIKASRRGFGKDGDLSTGEKSCENTLKPEVKSSYEHAPSDKG